MDPVFIIGSPRSGSTFLGARLGGFPRTVTIPETQFFFHAWKLYSGPSKVDWQDVWAELVGHWRFRLWDLDPEGIAQKLDDHSLQSMLRALVRSYADKQGMPSSEMTRFIDHTPRNVMRAGVLAALFPAAKFLHLIRDGRAVFSSVRKLDWGPSTCEAAAGWWARHVAAGLAFEETHDDRCLQVRYELLMRSHDAEMERIREFLMIDSDAALVEGTFSLPRYTRSQHELVSFAPDVSRVDAWRAELSGRQIEIFEFFSAGMLAHLGYDMTTGHSSKGPSALERAQAAFAEWWHNEWGNLRQRKRFLRSTTGYE